MSDTGVLPEIDRGRGENTGMPKHATRIIPREPSAVLAAWAVLVGMGGTSVTYNIWHAFHAGRMMLGLALLYGIAPVFAAMCLSHMVAAHKGGRWMQVLTFAVMAGAMTLSIGAIAAVVAPAAGELRWLFGAVLDAAALVALRVVLTERERAQARVMAAEDDALEAARQQAQDAAREAQEAAGRAELAEAELVTVRAELAAERERTSARNPRRTSARKPARKPAATSARNQGGPSGAEADLDKEALALRILAAEPGISGSELGRRVGASDRYGRDLLKRLAVPLNGNGAKPS